MTAASSPRFGLTTLVLVAAVAAGAAAGATMLLGRGGGEPAVEAAAKLKYQCPMHPAVVQDHPGNCPICGMKLVKVTPDEAATPEPVAAHATFHCPMHPQVVDDHASSCPICGMKLVQIPPAEASAANVDPSAAKQKDRYECPMHPDVVEDHPAACPLCGMALVKVAPSASPALSDLATVTIDPARQQLIGLRTVPASRGPIEGAWRTVGRVSVDETRVRRVNVKVPLYVEKSFADFVGKRVERGQPLFSGFSPELLNAQDELLSALRAQRSSPGSSDLMVRAARRKLQLWDVPESEIRRIEQTGEASKILTFHSPISGVVTRKDVVDGTRLAEGDMPYEIVDLSQVWVLADVYERELRNLKLGMPGSLTLKAFPDRIFEGKVAFIDPVLDSKTRTVKVRLVFANDAGELRPEMFGDVILKGASREGLRIPIDAVIDSGTRSVVFVALGKGKLQPREVTLGTTDGHMVEVASGLGEGEVVVTRANFLVDSESRLRASLATLNAGAGHTGSHPKAAAPAPDAGTLGARR